MSNNNKWLIGGIAGVLLVCACVSLACIAAGGLVFFQARQQTNINPPPAVEATIAVTEENFTETGKATTTPTTEGAQQESPTLVPTRPASVSGSSSGADAKETLNTLENEVVPINDARDLARRLEGKKNIPETIPGPKEALKVGLEQSFWASNVETNKNFQVKGTLRYVTDHLYFWIENGASYDPSALKSLRTRSKVKYIPPIESSLAANGARASIMTRICMCCMHVG